MEPPDRQRAKDVQLGTIHKAKGLGWQWVYWLQPEDIPLEWVVKGGGWRARQERNAEYVALTRSYMHLVKLRHFDPREVGLRQGIESLFSRDGDSGAAGATAGGPSAGSRSRAGSPPRRRARSPPPSPRGPDAAAAGMCGEGTRHRVTHSGEGRCRSARHGRASLEKRRDLMSAREGEQDERFPKRWASIQVKATRMGKQSAAQKRR